MHHIISMCLYMSCTNQLRGAIQDAGYAQDLVIFRPPTSNSFANSVRSGRIIVLQVPSMKQCHLSEPRRHSFSVTVLALWNSIFLQIHKVLSLQLFCKFLKMYLYSQAGLKVTIKPLLVFFGYIQLFQMSRSFFLSFFLSFYCFFIVNICKLPRLAASWSLNLTE